MKLYNFSEILLDALPRGRSAALPARHLATVLGCTRRDISRAVSQLRRAGVPVCGATSFPAGYFIAENASELDRWIFSVTKRQDEMALNTSAARAGFYNWVRGGERHAE